jgi:membrane-associated phospholipid phosphatase
MRRFHSIPVVLTLLLTLAGQTRAQSMGGMVWDNLRNSAGDMWAVWTSPFRATTRDWLIAGAVLGAGAAVSPLDDDVDRWAYRNRDAAIFDALDPVREGGVVFSGRAITPIALGALAVGVVTKNQRLQEGLFGCLSSYGASSVVRNYVVYPLVARTRPDTRQPNVVAPTAEPGDQYDFSFPGSHDWGRHSFPGGHIANVFACSEFLTRRFSMGLAEPVVWAVAAGVGIGRTVDRRHWFSDQLIGAVYGYAVGKEVALRSGRRADARNAAVDAGKRSASSLFLEPTSTGWNVGFRRAF